MSDYENIISGGRGETNFKECEIEIEDESIISLKPISAAKVITMVIIKDGKCIDSVKSNKYIINLHLGETGKYKVLAIDENVNLYMSNEIDYICNGQYLYANGEQFTDITNGWKVISQRNFTYEFLDDHIYMSSTTTSDCLGTVITDRKIDLTNYSKLCCEVIYKGTNCGYEGKLGITTETNHYPTLSKSTTMTAGNEKTIYEIDISTVTGSYYPVISGGIELSLYRMWLE